MGEQGAKSLRGGKMEDVIFAGTSGRPPLGRAEVSLTIDNTDGALPIDYTEVTITRTMFRGGGSEYAINGTSCRLLDVQELLSDSGLGREMHVIVGQGQLDTVLRATPEERRGFIEEAAGVLKHRRRKERALRKLETMELNLTRVQDLTGEIRRQLGPLGRQAEAARRAAVIQADARDARLRLLADDLVQLTGVLEQEVADETALIERRTAVEDALADVRQRLSDVERRSAEAAPELTRAHDRFVRLQSLRDRMESTGSVAAERVRLLSQDEEHETTSGRDPEELRAQAAQAREAEAALLAEVAATTEELAVGRRRPRGGRGRLRRGADPAARASRAPRPTAARAWPSWPARSARAAAGSRPGRPRSAASRSSSPPPGPGPPRPSRSSRASRAASPSRRRARRASTTPTRSAAARLAEAEAEIERLVTQEREAERDRSSATARIEALELSLRRKDGAATLLAAADADHAVVGTVAALLHVTGGHEAAVAAALGWASEALAVPSAEHAARAIASLRDGDGGRAALLVGGTASPSDPATWPALDGSAVWARDVVRAPDSVRPAVEQLLERVALVPTAAHAVALVARGEGITAVTADGDVFGPGWARGGSSAGESLLELQAAVDETAQHAGCRDRPRRARPVRAGGGPRAGPRGRRRGRGGARGAARVRRPDGRRRRAARRPRCRRAHLVGRGRPHRARHHRGTHRPRPRPRRARGAAGAPGRGRGRADRGGRGPLDRRARPPRARRQPGPHRRDRAAADPAHPRGARPRAQGPRRLARGRRPQRAGRPRAAA